LAGQKEIDTARAASTSSNDIRFPRSNAEQLPEPRGRCAGEVGTPLADMFWGAKFGLLKDKYGIEWFVNCDMA
jgi:hypothetical protein